MFGVNDLPVQPNLKAQEAPSRAPLLARSERNGTSGHNGTNGNGNGNGHKSNGANGVDGTNVANGVHKGNGANGGNGIHDAKPAVPDDENALPVFAPVTAHRSPAERPSTSNGEAHYKDPDEYKEPDELVQWLLKPWGSN